MLPTAVLQSGVRPPSARRDRRVVAETRTVTDRPGNLLGQPSRRGEPGPAALVVCTFIQSLMGAEADAICGAGYGERTDWARVLITPLALVMAHLVDPD